MGQQQRKTIKIQPGSRVQLRVGSRNVMGVVEQALRRELRVRLEDAAAGELLVRWLAPDGDAWRVKATAAPMEDGLCSLRLHDEWQHDAMRASQRITGSRHSIRGEMQAGSLPPGSRLDVVCLDLSASGCRVSGVGRRPKPGDLVRLALVHPWEDERWVLSRVMRVTPLAFGRFEVGFQFEADSPVDRGWLTGWRDAWSYVSSDELITAADEPPAADEAA
jgi:PilZ domain